MAFILTEEQQMMGDLARDFAKKEIAYKPLIPTRAYIILLNIVIEPNNAATKSNLKKPIKPQFTAPIITKSKAIVSNTFIKTTPLYLFIYIFYIKKCFYVF